MIRRTRQILDWLGSHGGLVLAAMLVVVGGTWGFVELLDQVMNGGTKKFDSAAIEFAGRFHGDNFRMLEQVGRDITSLGGMAVLLLVTLGVLGFLLMLRNCRASVLVLIAVGGGIILSGVLKHAVDRDRPELSLHADIVYTKSFPSGHSMMSAVVYLTLGSLLASVLPKNSLKVYVLGLSLVLTFLVGVSRVYMRVHWPTDVLAGWTAGLVWAILCWLVARFLHRTGAMKDVHEIDAA